MQKQVLRLYQADEIALALCARRLQEGKLVAFPTETVYGLGGNALMDSAVTSIYQAKGRPSNNPLIVHLANMDDAKTYVEWTDLAENLARQFWPGALTLVLKRKPDCPLSMLVSAGGDSVALRVPNHPLAQKLLALAGCPVAAPSANPSGRISPTKAEHVLNHLRLCDIALLDGGACAGGIESTVVDARGKTSIILRPGGISDSMLGEAVYGQFKTVESLPSPGMLASHYAPQLPMLLNQLSILPNHALIAFGQPVPVGAADVIQLSETGNLHEAATHLYSAMHRLDRPDLYQAIAVMPIPMEGVGIAINDRLKRAAQQGS